MIYDSILDTIGNTPIVRLHRTGPDHVSIYVKIESFNPMASVKDRLAYAIIKDARDSGALKPGQTVVEATSGNTGIALAMVCAVYGHPFVATMVETFSVERRRLMRALGAKVILTPAAERGSGMVRRAEELSKKHGWFLARQFENPANPAYHRNTTAPEILRDFAGKRLDYWVTGWGTGGTLTGVGEVLKVARPNVKIVVVEPASAAMLSGKEWKPHKIQGWTPDFIPARAEQESGRRIRFGRGPGCTRHGAAPCTEGRHLRRHFSGGNACRCARRRKTRAERQRHAGDASGHRRALSLNDSVRRHTRRLGRRVAREPRLSRQGELRLRAQKSMKPSKSA